MRASKYSHADRSRSPSSWLRGTYASPMGWPSMSYSFTPIQSAGGFGIRAWSGSTNTPGRWPAGASCLVGCVMPGMSLGQKVWQGATGAGATAGGGEPTIGKQAHTRHLFSCLVFSRTSPESTAVERVGANENSDYRTPRYWKVDLSTFEAVAC